jgi:hypothetical protein
MREGVDAQVEHRFLQRQPLACVECRRIRRSQRKLLAIQLERGGLKAKVTRGKQCI